MLHFTIVYFSFRLQHDEKWKFKYLGMVKIRPPWNLINLLYLSNS